MAAASRGVWGAGGGEPLVGRRGPVNAPSVLANGVGQGVEAAADSCHVCARFGPVGVRASATTASMRCCSGRRCRTGIGYRYGRQGHRDGGCGDRLGTHVFTVRE